jgi:hypothetical protein
MFCNATVIQIKHSFVAYLSAADFSVLPLTYKVIKTNENKSELISAARRISEIHEVTQVRDQEAIDDPVTTRRVHGGKPTDTYQ